MIPFRYLYELFLQLSSGLRVGCVCSIRLSQAEAQLCEIIIVGSCARWWVVVPLLCEGVRPCEHVCVLPAYQCCHLQGEYVGELLSQEECERRGQVYDIINSSYLFQLNTEWAIDARKAGSKLRCATSGPGLWRRVGTFPTAHRACVLLVQPGPHCLKSACRRWCTEEQHMHGARTGLLSCLVACT